MNNAAAIKNGVLAALAAAGGWIAHALGGWDSALQVLVWMMAADYLTGLLIAAIWHKSSKSKTGALDSKASFAGLCKKGIILMLVGIGNQLDRAIGADYLRTTIVLFFIGNEGLSLLENAGLMGIPMPGILKSALEALKSKGEG